MDMPTATPPSAPGAPPAAAAPPSPPNGSTAPATMRPDSQGMQQRGRVIVSLAASLLNQAVGMMGPMTPEGRDVLTALTALSKSFGKASPDLQKAETKLLAERASPTGQPGPENLAAMKSNISQRLQSQGVGAGG